MSRREHRITVAIGGALLMEALAALFWAGAAAARLDEAERRLEATTELTVRTARLEEQGEHIEAALLRVEAKLDAMRGER